MGKNRWRRFEKNKGYIVFPFAIVWEDSDPLRIYRTSKLTIHFLWWHWGFRFERE